MWKREDKKPLSRPKIGGIITLEWMLIRNKSLDLSIVFQGRNKSWGPLKSTFNKISGSIRFGELIPLDGFARWNLICRCS